MTMMYMYEKGTLNSHSFSTADQKLEFDRRSASADWFKRIASRVATGIDETGSVYRNNSIRIEIFRYFNQELLVVFNIKSDNLSGER